MIYETVTGSTPSGNISESRLLELEKLAKSTSQCILTPLKFFLSWSGVLVLTYEGFPRALESLKEHIASNITSLPPENSGSKWPKTSLGCLADGVRITPQQMELLLKICWEESQAFSKSAASLQQEINYSSMAVPVDALKVVVYECRSLERRISCQNLPFGLPLDKSSPSSKERERVASVLLEAESEGYWFQASRDGSRENHYRGNALGVTLVHDLQHAFTLQKLYSTVKPQEEQGTLQELLRRFRDRVDRELPGLYRWFTDDSLHVTLRAVMG
ncbi:hypothetical protein CEUSTIGMA_g11563.t1 [Chlamydomonas eustigma]|uniref:Uncharacterized protein n=1 Tax=Chlamydomonas eustigma TaxID=1157962 RepID=A0A250XMW4_9CHLO|nr:hypothetical protein CEUSTIGMA_g11563.t1 [Chlamydomonas eustigma]|eukprot:GAX84140.1 hypothetical protein CEUSTIGMA_g11563.t1 [Chlamydomonas eustigma]